MERDRSDDGIAFTGRAPRVPFPGQDVEPGRAVHPTPPTRTKESNLDYVLMRGAPPTRQTRRTRDRQALSARRTRRPQGTS